MNNRATPEKIMMNKHALALLRLYNNTNPSLEWCALHFNQILTSRQTKFKSGKSNRLKVGQNALSNRFFILNDQIPIKCLRHSKLNVKNCSLIEMYIKLVQII